MSQNISTAVMQRRVEPHDSLDDFPTPPWATRALIEHVIWRGYQIEEDFCGWSDRERIPTATIIKGQTVWEPACNRGHMVLPLLEYFWQVHASDVHDYGFDGLVHDFLFPGPAPFGPVDWIISNPPFRLAAEFARRAFEFSPRVGIALLVRTAFLEGVGRYDGLFRDRPPSIVAQFTERVVMVKGRLDGEGSTATAYCWLVWLTDAIDSRMTWIPPCRRKLERPGDYEASAI